MTITEMLGQSGLLTLLGMCVVFGFIIIMIICMKLLQLFVHVCKLDKETPAETTGKGAAPAQKNDGAIVAAIAAAIKSKEGK
ncbi:MAG: OadG family protein [Treponema sp.]|nr:OadG family protein [Treponema sp.]